jgi:hypothetical protein
MRDPNLLFALRWARHATRYRYRDGPVPYAPARMPGSTNSLLWQLGRIYAIAGETGEAFG